MIEITKLLNNLFKSTSFLIYFKKDQNQNYFKHRKEAIKNIMITVHHNKKWDLKKCSVNELALLSYSIEQNLTLNIYMNLIYLKCQANKSNPELPDNSSLVNLITLILCLILTLILLLFSIRLSAYWMR